MGRHTLAAILAALALMKPGLADEAAIRGTIDDQIAAFRADDFARAFGFAAPGIRAMFRTPENFGRMVQQGYPMVWRPGAVEFLGAEQRGPRWEQEVLITDGAGRLHRLIYTMVETAGGWRIAGVEIVSSSDPAV